MPHWCLMGNLGDCCQLGSVWYGVKIKMKILSIYSVYKIRLVLRYFQLSFGVAYFHFLKLKIRPREIAKGVSLFFLFTKQRLVSLPSRPFLSAVKTEAHILPLFYLLPPPSRAFLSASHDTPPFATLPQHHFFLCFA